MTDTIVHGPSLKKIKKAGRATFTTIDGGKIHLENAEVKKNKFGNLATITGDTKTGPTRIENYDFTMRGGGTPVPLPAVTKKKKG
jgi:hypothetical protein